MLERKRPFLFAKFGRVRCPSRLQVEKMYIPPVLDLPKGVYGNQLLFEKMMAESVPRMHHAT